MRAEYTDIQKAQGKAAALAAPTLDLARDLLAQAWDTRSPPAKDTLARWKGDLSIEPATDWMAAVQTHRTETVRRGVMEMFAATEARYMRELEGMSWRDVQHAQFALGILADKVLGRGAPVVQIDARDQRREAPRLFNMTYQVEAPQAPAPAIQTHAGRFFDRPALPSGR